MAEVRINAKTSNNNFAYDTEGTETIYRVPKPQEAIELNMTYIVASDTNFIEPTKDHKTLVLLRSANTSGTEKAVTFKGGNTFAGLNDYVVSLDGGEEKFVVLESAKFANKITGLIEVETDETTAGKIGIAVIETR